MLAEGAQNPAVQAALPAVTLLIILAALPIVAGLAVVAIRTMPGAQQQEPRSVGRGSPRSLPLAFPYLVDAEVDGRQLNDAQLVVTFTRGGAAARTGVRGARGGRAAGGDTRAAGRGELRVAEAQLIARVAGSADGADAPAGAEQPARRESVTVMLRRESTSGQIAFAQAEIVEAVTSPSGDRYVTLAFAPAEASAVGDALGIGPAGAVGAGGSEGSGGSAARLAA